MVAPKRRKIGVNNKETVVQPSTMADVPPACLCLRDWINDLYGMRHGTDDSKAWPLEKGGSFLEVTQRCFGNMDRLLSDSLGFVKAVGIVPRDSDLDAFANRFLAMKVFPPQPGSFLTTSVLQWSFDDAAFWRTPDSATVLDIAKSISLIGWREGEVIGLRLDPSVDEDTQMTEDGDSAHIGEFCFDDGGMRGLACAVCWIGMVYRCGKEKPEDLQHPRFVSLVRAMMQIPTMRKTQAGDPITEQIRRIIHQNVESKKMAISSFEWAEILRTMNKQSGKTITVAEAIDLYNTHPEVTAHGGTSSKDRTGAGSLVIDNKKMIGIRHWLEQTCSGARNEILIALKDNPFAYGPWGEVLAAFKPLFMKSTVTLATVPQAATGMVPLEGEATLSVNWSLPMDEWSQEMLFRRIRLHFQKATAIVEDSQDRKKYRMSEEDLLGLRNLVCVWSQLRNFLSTRIPNYQALEAAITSGNTADQELQPLLEHRPCQFAPSFLPSSQQAAMDNVKKQEEVVTLEAQKQQLELRDLKWKYFKSALVRDQEILATIQAAPKRLEALRHRKQMAWKVEQSQQGERLVKAYMAKYLRTEFVEKMEHAQLKINEYRQFVASSCSCREGDVHIISVVDLNVPLAKSKEKVEELCALVKFTNDLNPGRHVGIIELPEQAKKSSKRGLADEESDLQQVLWGLRQLCDSRWVLPFDVHPSADAQSARRRFSFGRLVVNKDFEADNPWVNNSEFGCAGRPLSDEKILLPLSRELLLPESLDADNDLRFAERTRPSPEALAAQKGQHRWLTMLRSLLNMTNYSLKGKPVILLNLTPYVEDLGVSAFHLHESHEEIKGGFQTNQLFYQSIWFLNKDQYGAARLAREVVDRWLQGKLEVGGQRINLDPPGLTNDEIATVPGGSASLSNLDSVQFEILERSGGKMVIRADEHKCWSSQGGAITEEYNEIRSHHQQTYGSGVESTSAEVVAAETEAAQSEPTTSSAAHTSATEEKESLAKLQESPGVDLKCASEVTGVELILAKDSSLWLLATSDKLINKHAQLGGFGTGQYVPAEGEEGIEFKLPNGDKSLIQLDESSWKPDGQGTTVISLYKLLVMCENEKNVTDHKVSYLSVTRKADQNLEGGLDGFDITYKNKMRFKCLPQDRLSGKNFFAKLVGKATQFEQIMPVFRFRYERVGATLKLQKVHMISKGSIQLKAGKPLKVT